jgi:hypothetical protein
MKDKKLTIIPIKNFIINSSKKNHLKSEHFHILNINNILKIKNARKIKKSLNLNILKRKIIGKFLIVFFLILFLGCLIEYKFNFFNIHNEFLNIFIVAHHDFPNKLTNQSYKIICDNKTQLENDYQLKIIETYEDNELFQKRRGYCEGSKIFYIWKNYKKRKMSSKYVGFVHYRRVFTFRNNIPDLDKIFTQYDYIIKKKSRLKKTLKIQFSIAHIGNFLDEIVEIIKENFTEYYQSANKTLNGNHISFCNIFIMKKEDFIKYGEFVFGVLLEFDRRHKIKNDDDIKDLIVRNKKSIKRHTVLYQCRQHGFLMERISQIFYDYYFKKPLEIRVARQSNN